MADGYGEFGGNGSVEWAVDVAKVEWACSAQKAGGGQRQSGVDPVLTDGRYFRVYVEPSGDKEFPPVWRVDASGRVYFELPIVQHTRNQIRVEWAYERSADRVLEPGGDSITVKPSRRPHK